MRIKNKKLMTIFSPQGSDHGSILSTYNPDLLSTVLWLSQDRQLEANMTQQYKNELKERETCVLLNVGV